jgi:hypothetical protein
MYPVVYFSEYTPSFDYTLPPILVRYNEDLLSFRTFSNNRKSLNVTELFSLNHMKYSSLRACSPQVNYTDRATAACRRG